MTNRAEGDRLAELLPRHRPASVDDEAEVERLPLHLGDGRGRESDEDREVTAVFTGIAGRSGMREIPWGLLSSETRRQEGSLVIASV